MAGSSRDMASDAADIPQLPQVEQQDSRLSEGLWGRIAEPFAAPVDKAATQAAVQDIKVPLNSAFASMARGNVALAEKDFQSAIQAADSVDPKWLQAQDDAATAGMGAAIAKQTSTTQEFVNSVDSLPTATRQRVNSLMVEFQNHMDVEGFNAWDTHRDLVDKMKANMPPEMRRQLQDCEDADKGVVDAMQARNQAGELAAAPLKTRALAARFYAMAGDEDKSREMLNEMFKLHPDLKDSPSFMAAMEDPSILKNTEWLGESPRPADPSKEMKKQIEKALGDLFRNLLGGEANGGGEPEMQHIPGSTRKGAEKPDERGA